MGKHLDKYEADRDKEIHTLPVLLGTERSIFLTQELIVAFFVVVLGLVLVGTLGVWTLLVFGAIPQAFGVLKVLGRPRPEQAPPGYPIWPLWYAAWAVRVARVAGALLVLSLVLNAIWPVYLV